MDEGAGFKIAMGAFDQTRPPVSKCRNCSLNILQDHCHYHRHQQYCHHYYECLYNKS